MFTNAVEKGYEVEEKERRVTPGEGGENILS